MNIDQFKNISVAEFVRAVLPSLPQNKLDEFCDPIEFDKIIHFSKGFDDGMGLAVFRNNQRCEISLQNKDKLVKIAMRFTTPVHEHEEHNTLPRLTLHSIQVGRHEIAQHVYKDAFYAPGHKPGPLDTFRNRAYGINIKSHNLTNERLGTTCAGLDYACMHLSSGATPPMGALSPIFDKAPLSRPLALGAARLHGIRAHKTHRKQ